MFAFSTYMRGFDSTDPLHRFGIVDPCKNYLMHMSCVFSGYTAMHKETHTDPKFFQEDLD